jgi:hypothetical protein
MESPPWRRRDVIRYMESQAPDETVQHTEKLMDERILGQKHEVWDVHTDKGRWWVITNITNLYSQDEHPSADETLSFHLGLMARIIDRQHRDRPDDERYYFPGAWRRFEQATEAFDAADEAEEIQAVAMRCRECLLAAVRDVADESFVASGAVTPKLGDFIHWSELIAESMTPSGRLRTYLKSLARTTWDLTQWLTHDTDATRADAEIVLGAAENTLVAYTQALLRYRSGAPKRCPECGSYKIHQDFRPEMNIDPPYVTMCEACEWEDTPRASDPSPN